MERIKIAKLLHYYRTKGVQFFTFVQLHIFTILSVFHTLCFSFKNDMLLPIFSPKLSSSSSSIFCPSFWRVGSHVNMLSTSINYPCERRNGCSGCSKTWILQNVVLHLQEKKGKIVGNVVIKQRPLAFFILKAFGLFTSCNLHCFKVVVYGVLVPWPFNSTFCANKRHKLLREK